jgi:hypothetical protein
MPSPRPQRYIRRIDNERTYTHSWHVSIRCRGQIITRHFSDNVCGGKRKALKAAIAFRDATLTQFRGTDYALWLRRERSNNTSGIVGVGRYVNRSETTDQTIEYPYWQAFWRDLEGKRHSRTFSVLQHGERKARKLAIVARRAAIEEMLGIAADKK